MLYQSMSTHDCDLVFPDRCGCKLSQRNLLRDYKLMARKAGVKEPRGFHQLRHLFALAFVRDGGDVFALQRILGHATLEMTRRYVYQTTTDLQEKHRQHARLLMSGAGR